MLQDPKTTDSLVIPQSYNICLTGTVSEGFGHASGTRSTKYPEGTINLQKPHFKSLGLDIEHCFSGTLNVDIAPLTYQITNPEFNLKNVDWKSGRIPENFLIARAIIIFGEKIVEGFIYYPDPKTKTGSIDKPNHLQVIAPFIPGIELGKQLELRLRSSEISIK